jgi:hypothetical protein
VHATPDLLDLIGNFRQGLRIGLLDGQINQNTGILDILVQSVEGIDPLSQRRSLLQDGGGGVGVIPEPVAGDLRLDFL